MEINILGIALRNGMNVDEILSEKESLFVQTEVANGNFLILRSKKMITFKGARFRIIIQFGNRIIECISLIAAKQQESPEYIECENQKKLHELWLLKNYGEPTRKERYGYIYEFEDGKICSEYDPRSGSSEIILSFFE